MQNQISKKSWEPRKPRTMTDYYIDCLDPKGLNASSGSTFYLGGLFWNTINIKINIKMSEDWFSGCLHEHGQKIEAFEGAYK